MKKISVFLWVLAGLSLCAGIVLISLGTSFLLSDCSEAVTEPPTCDSEGCGEPINVEFDSKYLRVQYSQSSISRTLLSVHLGQTPAGDRPLGLPRIVQGCTDARPVCADVTFAQAGLEETTIHFTVNKIEDSLGVTCFESTWESSNDNAVPVDCFQMSDFWFGGAEMYYQDWPINSWNKHMSFYLSGDMFADPQQYGSVLERYWLSSQGVAIWVPSTVPLHVSTEKQQICFKGSYENPYNVRNEHHPHHWLQYTTCFGKTPQVVHDYMFNEYFQRPTGLPDLRMIQHPIWSTWARYKVDINESVVLTYADEILKHGFPNSQLEIDDGYEVYYGDHTFDSEKFPNASGMIETLHELGFRVTTWVTPFVNLRSDNYEAGDSNKYFIISGRTNESGKVAWWNGVGSSIDFTNGDACDWYAGLLEDIKSTYGVDSYKFDAGEINYVTVVPEFQSFLAMENIGIYTQKYAECAYRLGTQIELRAAWNCHHLPVFVRMMDKDSNWGPAKGLKTLIPTALTFSLLGYPYILPDMIGGNAYEDGFHGTPLPERELYIRWLELTAFLPSMQFSYVPWQYDDETVEIAKKYVKLHENEIYDELIKSSNEYINRKSGLGPIRPIWWVSKDDNRAFAVDDEFLVGDRYLVAPIVNNNTRSRDIYLPGPLWRDGTQKLIWEDKLSKKGPTLGGTTIYDYPIELHEISWWELRLE